VYLVGSIIDTILFIFLVWRELEKGPEEHVEPQPIPARAVAAEAR